jgi:hypothetical protein
MRCPCPFLQVDSVSLSSDSVLSSKAVFQKSNFCVLRQCFQKVTKFTFWERTIDFITALTKQLF